VTNKMNINVDLEEFAGVIEDDKRHENTQLALKVNDGNMRLRRIVEFNKFLQQLEKQKQTQQQPQQPKYKMATPEQKKQAQNRPPMTEQRERELDKKVNETAEDFGFPPVEESELYDEEVDINE